SAIEYRVMHHFVQQDGEIEYREALHQGQGHPDERIGPDDESGCGGRENRELPCRDHQVASPGLPVDSLQLFTGQRAAELGPECRRVLAVMMLFHWSIDCTPAGFRAPAGLTQTTRRTQ